MEAGIFILIHDLILLCNLHNLLHLIQLMYNAPLSCN